MTINYDKDSSGNEPPHELNIDDSNKSAQKWTLTDDDIHAESGYFNVTVSYSKQGTQENGIGCDPRWEVE